MKRQSKNLTRNQGPTERTKIKRRPRLKRGQSWPDFDTLFDPDATEESPLDDIEYTGDIERDTQEEMSEALKAVIAHRKSMHELWRLAVDTEFWVAVCFQSREQKEEFLQKAGIIDLGDKYLDGLKVADKLGIEIEPIILDNPPPKRAPRGLRSEKMYISRNKGGDS